MNLIFNDSVRKKYFDPTPPDFMRDPRNISEIVIHGTGGGASAQAIINWMLSGERAEMYKKGIGLFHYEIDTNGDIYNLLPDSVWCFHSDCLYHDKNTIGIELLNRQAGNAGMYSKEQYKALGELIIILCKTYHIESIVSHDYNRGAYSHLAPKPCPGNLFNWAEVEIVVTDNVEQTIDIRRG